MMSFLSLILIGGTTLLIIFWHFMKRKRPPGFPPGPSPIPILGNLLQASLETHKIFIEIGKKYGGIFAFDLGSYSAVIINDLNIMKQCLNDPAFAGRPLLQVFLDKSGPGATSTRGIITSELQIWSEQRRFTIKNLRDFGFGKASMEQIIQEEIKEFIDTIRKEGKLGKPMKTRGIFNIAVLNSLWRMCTGTRTPQSDPQLQAILETLIAGISALSPVALFFPIIARAFPRMIGYNKVLEAIQQLADFIKQSFLEHQATFVPGQPRDLLDTMCEEVAATTDPESSFYGSEGVMNCLKSAEDVFIGGAETTSTTLNWIFLFMALHPNVQEKMSMEIEKVVGVSRLPFLSDRPMMPFTECVIMEVLRSVSLFPLAVFHKTLEDVHVAGYFIPKGTIVSPNLYAVMHDEGIWGDPETFRPERFLLPDGTVNRSHEAFLPFSYGRRVCPGEKLAKEELFLFTASLFQQFRVTLSPDGPKPTLQCIPTMILSPIPHDLVIQDRR